MNGKNPVEFQLEDFVADESFVNYYFSLNKEDETYWENWLIVHPESRQLADSAKEMLQNLSLTLSEQEYKTELSRIRHSIHYKRSVRRRKNTGIFRLLRWKEKPRSKKKSKYLLYLSAALLVIGIGYRFFLGRSSTKADQLVDIRNETNKPIVVTLGDGTVVTLAAKADFKYPRSFVNRERNVYLDGEAQFQVTRDEAHPFKVHAGDITTTVLGTVFNIKRQPGDSVIVVELLKGKLRVEISDSLDQPDRSIILNPDERVVYHRMDQKLFKEKWGSQVESNLIPNHFLFQQNSFEEIASQLKNVFGITLINQSNKKNWRFTGEFKNTSALNILENICIVKKLKYTVQGDTVIIK
jgi:transmembrane sensor